jgi:hypothetical protein
LRWVEIRRGSRCCIVPPARVPDNAIRSSGRIRRPGHAIDGRNGDRIVDAISIRQRPAEVEDRAVPGHWEGDRVEGSRGAFIATLVERRSRFVILIKLSEKRTDVVVEALAKVVRKLPTAKIINLGPALGPTDHAKFTVTTDIRVYFCDPYCAWQRGSNENTNGLLRQYCPKGMDLSAVSQAQLDVGDARDAFAEVLWEWSFPTRRATCPQAATTFRARESRRNPAPPIPSWETQGPGALHTSARRTQRRPT